MKLIKKIAFRILQEDIDKIQLKFDDEYMSLLKECDEKCKDLSNEKKYLEDCNRELKRIMESRKDIYLSVSALKAIFSILPDCNEFAVGGITDDYFKSEIKLEEFDNGVKINEIKIVNNGLKIVLFDRKQIEIFIPVKKKSFQYKNNSNITADVFVWDFSDIKFQIFNDSVWNLFNDYFNAVENLFNNKMS